MRATQELFAVILGGLILTNDNAKDMKIRELIEKLSGLVKLPQEFKIILKLRDVRIALITGGTNELLVSNKSGQDIKFFFDPTDYFHSDKPDMIIQPGEYLIPIPPNIAELIKNNYSHSD